MDIAKRVLPRLLSPLTVSTAVNKEALMGRLIFLRRSTNTREFDMTNGTLTPTPKYFEQHEHPALRSAILRELHTSTNPEDSFVEDMCRRGENVTSKSSTNIIHMASRTLRLEALGTP